MPLKKIKVIAKDPEGDELTYTVNIILKGDGNAIFTDPNKNELTLTKNGTNKIFSFVDAANENIKDEAKLEVVVCDPSLNCSFAIITIEITDTNDPPSIKQSYIYPEKPIFDKDFHVQFEIIDPDYDFKNIPSLYYGSYKLTFDSWLTCSQQGHEVGSMMIICNGIPIKKEDNKFSIDIMFKDGNSTAKESFKYEAIDYADFLNP